MTAPTFADEAPAVRDGGTEGRRTFGTMDPSRECIARPGSYAVIQDASGRIAAVETPRGLYLPGGGLRPGEPAIDGLARECREECGFTVATAEPLGDLCQFLDVPGEGQLRIDASIFRVTVASATTEAVEPGHRTRWLDPAESASMAREFERAAVERWAADRGPRTPGPADEGRR